MPTNILMPALSPTMEEGTLAKWLKNEGDTIKSGDVIAEIETDKATMEVEATDEGTLGKILIPEGTADVAVNTPIAMILADGESSADLAKAPAAAAAPNVAQEVAESRSPVGEGTPMISAPAHIAAPAIASEPEPEVPAGTEFVSQTIREALRDAMAEEAVLAVQRAVIRQHDREQRAAAHREAADLCLVRLVRLDVHAPVKHRRRPACAWR